MRFSTLGFDVSRLPRVRPVAAGHARGGRGGRRAPGVCAGRRESPGSGAGHRREGFCESGGQGLQRMACNPHFSAAAEPKGLLRNTLDIPKGLPAPIPQHHQPQKTFWTNELSAAVKRKCGSSDFSSICFSRWYDAAFEKAQT